MIVLTVFTTPVLQRISTISIATGVAAVAVAVAARSYR